MPFRVTGAGWRARCLHCRMPRAVWQWIEQQQPADQQRRSMMPAARLMTRRRNSGRRRKASLRGVRSLLWVRFVISNRRSCFPPFYRRRRAGSNFIIGGPTGRWRDCGGTIGRRAVRWRGSKKGGGCARRTAYCKRSRVLRNGLPHAPPRLCLSPPCSASSRFSPPPPTPPAAAAISTPSWRRCRRRRRPPGFRRR